MCGMKVYSQEGSTAVLGYSEDQVRRNTGDSHIGSHTGDSHIGSHTGDSHIGSPHW